MSSPSNVLLLYRAILRTHRRKLPKMERSVGDAFVKEEFRKHRNADPKFVKNFMHEWSSYLVMLQQQQGDFGVDLSSQQISSMNEEQLGQMEELRSAAFKDK
eukprot:SAG31_NODE_963_length_10710_cov_332.216285_10_plen_102_part_00